MSTATSSPERPDLGALGERARGALVDVGHLVRFRTAGLGETTRRRLRTALVVVGLLTLLAGTLPAFLPGAEVSGRSDDLLLLLPSAYLGVLAIALITAASSGGGRELIPRDQAVAFPVDPATDHLGALLMAPLNIAWLLQTWTVLGLTAYALGPGGCRSTSCSRCCGCSRPPRWPSCSPGCWSGCAAARGAPGSCAGCCSPSRRAPRCSWSPTGSPPCSTRHRPCPWSWGPPGLLGAVRRLAADHARRGRPRPGDRRARGRARRHGVASDAPRRAAPGGGPPAAAHRPAPPSSRRCCASTGRPSGARFRFGAASPCSR